MPNLIDILVDPNSINILELADRNGRNRAYEQLTYLLFGSAKSKTMYVVMKPFERIGIDDDELCVFKVTHDEDDQPCLRIVKDELTTVLILDIYRMHYEVQAKTKNDKPKSSVDDASTQNTYNRKNSKETKHKTKSSVDEDIDEDIDEDFADVDDDNPPKGTKHKHKKKKED